MRWCHDHHRGAGWVPQVWIWRNWCRTSAAPWSTSPAVILKVSASGYLLHLPFGAIATLGLHDSGCTLELHLQPYWLEMEMLVGDGMGSEKLSQLQFVMWLVVLLGQGDHAYPYQFWLNSWRVCLYFAMDFADDFVVDDPVTFYYFIEREFATNIFRFGSHSWLFLFHQAWCAWMI